jgi:ATP-dependent protease HslVU (ClpYQ) peptidase subunit
MTTIIGIKVSNEYAPGVIIGSDTQLNIEEEELEEKRRNFRKIIYGRNWALAHSGDIDRHLGVFYSILLGKRRRYISADEVWDNIIKRAIENYSESKRGGKKERRGFEDLFARPHFNLVNLLNSSSIGGVKWEYEGNDEDVPLHNFLLGSCPPLMGLWYVDTHGNLREVSEFGRDFDYLSIGSGGKHAIEHMKEMGYSDRFDLDNLTLEDAIEIIWETLDLCRDKDPNSGGPFDLVVLDKNGVHYYGDYIKNELKKAETYIKENIKNKHTVKD